MFSRLSCALMSMMALLASVHAQETVLSDHFFIISENGHPIGRYRERTVRKTTPGKPDQIVTIHEQKRAMLRGRDVAKIEEVETYIEDERGRPIRYTSRQQSGPEIKTVDASIAQDRIELAVKASGAARKVDLAYSGRLLFPHGERLLRTSQGYKVGTEYTYQLFIPDLGNVKKVSAKVLSPQHIAIPKGSPSKLWHTMELTGIAPGITMRVWCDEKGYMHRAFIDLNKLEVVACTREDWARPIGRPKQDVLASTAVGPGVHLPPPSRLKEVVYKLTLSKGKIGAVAWKDERQEVVRKVGANAIVLRVTRPPPSDPEPGYPLEIQKRDRFKEFLQPSAMLQCDDPEIVRTAKATVKGATGALQAARKLEHYVFRSIRKKDYGTGFVSASEVQKTRAGDCTEHSVWLAALLRAVGIPSKLATGLTLSRHGFSHHMWTEAWVGRWVALDATTCAPSVDPCHIELADTALAGAGVGEKVLASMQLRGRLKMQIERVVLANGKTLTAAQLLKTGSFQHGKFVDPAFGIALEVPWGCSLYRRGTPAPGKKKWPSNAVAVFADTTKGIAIAISSMPAPWADPTSSLAGMRLANLKKIPGGRLFVRPASNARAAYVIAPGAIFKLDLRVRSANDVGLLDEALKTLKVGAAVDELHKPAKAP